MLFTGNFLVVFGLFMLSLCTKYWQVFLAQAVCIGIGAGLLYIPSLALIGLSFSKKRSIAQGITTAGIAVGECICLQARNGLFLHHERSPQTLDIC
jgi:MFS family permease